MTRRYIEIEDNEGNRLTIHAVTDTDIDVIAQVLEAVLVRNDNAETNIQTVTVKDHA